tara:strand:+ start:2759 stop:2959 length:201 start_codon:yes stop_codon:yes gene_type:complete
MPKGVKSNLTDAEKYELMIKRNVESKRLRRLNDPDFVQKEKEYNKQYHARLREACLKARREKELEN